MNNINTYVYYTKSIKYYIKQIRNVDPLKPKVMKLTYTGKVVF
jgi:hypothetical protein